MAIPLYFQIYRDLQMKICGGTYEPGALLPTESELEKIYGTSRAPVRQALGVLENEGLVVRRQGKGTFVTDQARTSPWLIATGFLKCYERNWGRLTARTVELNMKVPEDPEIGAFLELPEGGAATRLVRLQCISEKPTVLLENFFHPHYDLNVFQAAGDFMSLKELLMSKFAVTARRSHERLAVRVPPPQFAAWLELPAGTPIMRVRRFIWDSADRPLLVSNQYVFTDEWEYEADFTMIM